jgi:hypothetical protein
MNEGGYHFVIGDLDTILKHLSQMSPKEVEELMSDIKTLRIKKPGTKCFELMGLYFAINENMPLPFESKRVQCLHIKTLVPCIEDEPYYKLAYGVDGQTMFYQVPGASFADYEDMYDVTATLEMDTGVETENRDASLGALTTKYANQGTRVYVFHLPFPVHNGYFQEKGAANVEVPEGQFTAYKAFVEFDCSTAAKFPGKAYRLHIAWEVPIDCYAEDIGIKEVVEVNEWDEYKNKKAQIERKKQAKKKKSPMRRPIGNSP